MSSPAPSSPKAAPASPKSSSKVAPVSPKSPKVAGEKRSLEESEDTPQSASKKTKTEEYALNFNKALDKEHENKSFSEIIKLPPSALQGLGDRADEMLKSFNIKTIEDLGKWKFFLIARSIVKLAEVEEKGKRPSDSRANINRALDAAHEKKSFTQIAKEPASALQGLAPWADSVLKPLGAGKISQLGSWKFALWAEAFTQLAAYENADMQS